MSDGTKRPPKENLVRAVFPGVEYRNAEQDDSLGTLAGHLAVWNQWAEIQSEREGHFIERIAPGAFTKYLNEQQKPRVLFQHGHDPQVGDKPLGPIRDLKPDDDGMYYEVQLLDTSYNRDLLPGLRAGLYGSSFRFSVMKDDFHRNAKKSAYNPDGLPERTIHEATLPEFGPVTFPAYMAADASARFEGTRSMTDDFQLEEAFDRLVSDPQRLQSMIDRRLPNESGAPLAAETALPTDGAAEQHSDEGSRSEPSKAQPLKDPPAVAATTPKDPPESGSSSVREDKPVSMKTIEELRSRKDEIQGRFQEIHVEHGVEKLPDEIQAEWDDLTAERSELEERITDYEERTAYIAKLADNPRNVERVGQATRTSTASKVPSNIYAVEEYRNLSNSDSEMKQAFRDGAMKAVDTAVFPHELADESKNKSNIAKLLASDEEGNLARHILSTGNPVYQRAFAKTLAGRMLSTEEQRAIATVGTTTAGGYAIPFFFDPTLILTSDGSVNPLRQMARVEQLTGAGNTWKGVTTAGITISRGPAELQPVTPTEITFGPAEVTAQPVKVEIQFSIEADEDWPRLQTELARVLQEAKDDEEAESFVNGVGTTVYPEGVAAGLDASSDVGTTGNGLDVSDLYRLEGALPPKYRARAQFLANKAIYSQIRQFSVGATGEGSVWTRGIATGDPAQLLGYSAREISTMEADPTADGERIMLFGDFRQGFLIVDKVGMTIEIDPHVRNGDGKWIGARALLVHYRNSSIVLNDNALRALVVGVVTS